MSLVQLQQLFEARKGHVQTLYERRQEIENQVRTIDEEIAALEGRNGTRRGIRRPSGSTRRTATDRRVALAQNKKSLKNVAIEVMAGKKGLKVGEVLELVQATGYVSSSANFKGVLYQCLYQNPEIFLPQGDGRYKVARAATAKVS